MFQGFGLGLRVPHYAAFLETTPAVDFVEVISENFMGAGGRPLAVLERVRSSYPVALHGVSLSLGSADGLRPGYLERLRALVDRVEPLFVSDHLAWTGVSGTNTHDLLPLPLTAEALEIAVQAVDRTQEALGRTILVENPSTYLRFEEDEMPEGAFLAALTERSGCLLLLDLNNVHVSAKNHGFDPVAYLESLPADRVRQFHLAGHSQGPEGLLIDTHDAETPAEVLALYAAAVRRFGPQAAMIERDDDIPPLATLLDELERVRALAAASLSAAP
jgi:uncharacterized protein (UPF0276 family)